MNASDLKSTLRRSYDRENWTGLIRSVFGDCVRLEARAQSLATEDDAIKSIAQIGDVQLRDGRSLALIEVEVADNINLLRNRVSLRNRVARFIDQDKAHGVLAVFSSSRPEYRFTFTARESVLDDEIGLVEQETATKRFTYVLGPGETCTTAASRFEQLSRKTDSGLSLNDVIEAFSVEKLNREFFQTYKDHYQQFCDYLLSEDHRAATCRIFNISKQDLTENENLACKPVRDFVKRLLGRLVFLCFLQRKGWMGCPADSSEWTGGDPDFLRHAYRDFDDPDHFHSRFLIPLFYEALNHPDRPDDVFALTGTRIPYLNGGLFERDHLDQAEIDFPATYFEALLEFFSQYNFTIDENDPDEHEVGIDPEMLGHIFENLLEDNKDKGAYYTPKAIVHYMSQQSLIYYLLSHLGNSEENRAAIEYLVRTKQRGENTPHAKIITAQAARIEELLDQVKICDPAIGSGAFPIGLLQEIFWLKLTLDLTLNHPAQMADVKRGIIQNSIYGVDKDSGAIDIARLRFWLSLVVDEDSPRPLPNLDYKIMQGDSLLESFEGIDLSRIHTGQDPTYITSPLLDEQDELDLEGMAAQKALQIQKRKESIDKLIHAYFLESKPDRKREIHDLVDTFILNHIRDSIAYQKSELEMLLAQQERMLAGELVTPKGWTEKKSQKRIQELQKQLTTFDEKEARLEETKDQAERPYFLWHLFFQDVFAQGGFDIVIANPPYVRQESIKAEKPLLEQEGYTCYKGTADLFVYFYERSVNLLRAGGILTYITSNKYYRSGYGNKLRGFLADQLTIQEMLDFGDAPVFDAIAYASILIGQKAKVPEAHSLKVWNWRRGDKVSRIAAIMAEEAFPLDQLHLTPDGWRLERPDVFALLAKLRSKGTPLGEYVEGRFYYGIKTGLNDAFVVDRATRDRLIREDPKSEEVLKPFLRGRDVKRWKIHDPDLWLIFARRGIDIEAFPAIKKHLHNFKDRLEPKPENWPANKIWPGRKAGSYQWYEIQDNIAYWQEFEKPKIIYPNICKRNEFCLDKKAFYANQKSFIIPEPDFITYCTLNSSVTEWLFPLLLSPLQNDFFEPSSIFIKHFPIPDAPEDVQVKLAKLAKEAHSASQLPQIESRINQIIYDLFDLTPDEIDLIESTLEKKTRSVTIEGEHGHTNKKESLFRRLRQLAKDHAYFNLDTVKQAAKADGLTDNDNLLREYMSEAMRDGIIHSAGRGWYTRLENKVELGSGLIEKLAPDLKENFPLLEFSCWSTTQLNPWMHHLLAQPIHFLNVDENALESVGEKLELLDWDVYVNPADAKSLNKVRPGAKSLVIRPTLSRAPKPQDNQAAIEQIMVDLLAETDDLKLMDFAEAQEVIENILAFNFVQISALQRYAESRGVDVNFVV